MNFKRVKITTTVPLENADDVREALGKAGAGVVGNYSFCSFSVAGTGYFMPNDPLTAAEKQHLYAYALAGTAMELLGGHWAKCINGEDTPETEHWIEVGRQGLKDALQEKIC